MGKKSPRGDKGIASIGLFELSDPRLFDYADDKLPRFTINGFVRSVILEPGLVDFLFPGADRCLLIVLDGRIAKNRLAWTGERDGVIRCLDFRIFFFFFFFSTGLCVQMICA